MTRLSSKSNTGAKDVIDIFEVYKSVKNGYKNRYNRGDGVKIVPFLMFLSSADVAVCGRFFMRERKADEENG